MIEFNEKAKEDNPIASILGVKGLKLFTDTLLITKTPHPVIVARQKPGKSTMSMINEMDKLGFVEKYPDYLPEDVYEWRKGDACLYSTKVYDGWMKLRSWKSLTNYMVLGNEEAFDTLFKIVVCNYVSVLDKDNKVVIKHPMTVPLNGAAFADDEDEPENETPATANWTPPHVWAQTTLETLQAIGEDGLAPTPVDAG